MFTYVGLHKEVGVIAVGQTIAIDFVSVRFQGDYFACEGIVLGI